MKRWIFPLLAICLLAGCCTTLHQGGSISVSSKETWALLPFINNTETPFAAEKAEAITASLLFARGIQNLERFPADAKSEELGADRGERRQREALELARQKKARYILTGAVNEWRYKVGLDGEPVAGITMQLVQLPEGKVVWSGTAGKSGWSRDAVSAVAQQVLDRLLGNIEISQ